MASNEVQDEGDQQRLCNVFISYQWKSQAKVKKLYSELSMFESLNVFMDIYKIKAGLNLYATLASNIQQADVILACVSREYVKSKNCEREVIYADAFNKPVIPLYIEKIPIPELGSIGFVLIRERFCSLYRNEKVFDNLSETDEFKDILDGILTVVKTKSIQLTVPFTNKKVGLVEVDESNIVQAVVQFRNDKPLEEISLVPSEPAKESSVNDNLSKFEVENVPEKGHTNLIQKIINKINKPTNQYLTGIVAAGPKGPQEPKFQNFLEMHPVIKEIKFLISPVVLLEPAGDRFQFLARSNLVRGGEPYFPPLGWLRYGLKISKVHKDIDIWLSKDGNPEEWAVVYYGFKTNPLRNVLYQRLFDTALNKFRPSLKKSNSMTYVNSKDINKNSDGYNNRCDQGIFCSAKPELAEEKTCCFILKNTKYKMLLQCRAKPNKIRIPQGNPDLRILNSSEFIRPYGILLKEV